jgi:hypothetical protein
VSRQHLICVVGVATAIIGTAMLFAPLPASAVLQWQGVVAAAGALLLGWGWWLRRRGRAEQAKVERDRCLIALTALTVFLTLAPSGFDFDRFVHGWDAFHYYMGGKYFRELGYYRLYDCTLIADAEALGSAAVQQTAVRDLRTNELKPAAEVFRHRDVCKERFTRERWRAFARDVTFFRPLLPPARWLALRTDHGYNPPPTWGLLATPLTNLAPASKAQVTALILLDPLLIGAMSGAIAWAFGWRVMCVALLFFGNNYPANWDWTGGSILRYDWLFAAVTGICVLRRQRFAAAGALLTWGVAIRVFPVLILAAVALGRIERMISERRLALEPGDRRLLAASLATAVVLFLGATAVAGGLGSWIGFAEKSRIHLATPLVNHAGLRSVLAYDHDLREAMVVDRRNPGDPYVRWREGRHDTFAARAPLFPVLVAAYLALLAVAVRRRPEWVAAVLGAGAIAVVFELTGYYHAILLVLAFLWPLREGVGIGLLSFAALSRLVASLGLARDEIFLLTNLMTLALVVGTTAAFARRDPPERVENVADPEPVPVG